MPTAWAVGALLVVLSVPLVVALVVLRQRHLYPYGDLAGIELRLRDLWSSQTPLVGAIGRFGPAGDPGHHPGPLVFYAMWPVYRVLGGGAWAMQVATVSIHVVAMGVSLWIAGRRGGLRLVVGVAALLAVLIHGYGPSLLADAWNPFVPLLWWLVFLLAVWSVVCDDLACLPVAALAASLCAQSHVSYVGATVALSIFAIGWALVRAHRAGTTARRQLRNWLLVSAALIAVLWLPPVIEQLTGAPGNLTKIWDDFTAPSRSVIGIGRGVEILLISLNPWKLLTHDFDGKIERARGSFVPGLVLVVAWAAAAATSWRLGHLVLRRLHLVLGVALAVAVASCSRVVGDLFSYLFLWAWSLTALMLFAVAWTLVALVRRVSPTRATWPAWNVVAAAMIVVLVLAGLTIGSATDTRIDDARRSRELGRLVGPTVEALRIGTAPEPAVPGGYLVTWADPLNFGLQGYGLLNELERRGFDVGTSAFYRGLVMEHRVLEPEDARAVVHLAIGAEISAWSAIPGARRVAYYEPRTRAQRAEYQRLRSRVIADVIAAGLRDKVHLVDENLITLLYFERQLPAATLARMNRMVELGLDLAVFVAPVGPDTT